MTIQTLADVEFGEELPVFTPARISTTCAPSPRRSAMPAVDVSRTTRRRAQGLPGALVPGIMGMGFLTTLIHRWAPTSTIRKIDTVFRAPVLADHNAVLSAVVTDIEEDEGLVHLDLTIKNDADETRVFGTATIELPNKA